MDAARPFGLILAGGAGRRLGGVDKALLTVAGTPLLSRVMARLAPQVGRVAVSANGDPSRLAAFAATVLDDGPWQGQGPLAGVLAGLLWARSAGQDRLVTVAVDTPFLPGDLVSRLLAAAEHGFAIAQSAGRRHPTCAVWPVRAQALVENALQTGERRIGHVLASAGAIEVAFDDDGGDPFMNINTPQDLAAAERRAGRS